MLLHNTDADKKESEDFFLMHLVCFLSVLTTFSLVGLLLAVFLISEKRPTIIKALTFVVVVSILLLFIIELVLF